MKSVNVWVDIIANARFSDSGGYRLEQKLWPRAFTSSYFLRGFGLLSATTPQFIPLRGFTGTHGEVKTVAVKEYLKIACHCLAAVKPFCGYFEPDRFDTAKHIDGAI